MKLQTQPGRKSVQLSKEIARGGEGGIWTVQGQPNQVAKVYHQPTSSHERKLEAMLQTPPRQPRTHTAIAWPTELLYQNRQFKGYLMPYVSGYEPLFKFYNPSVRPPGFNWKYLHQTALNLVIAVRAIHRAGHLIGDVNESNILANNQTLVTLVDTDSFQITDRQGHRYRCLVGKPEYTPPELQGAQFKTIDRMQSHDLFGLGCLTFQLLMEGHHPFSGRLQNLGLSVGRVDLYGIKQGIFPYQANSVIGPSPHAPAFAVLYPDVQDAFIRCFVDGHQDPSQRPTAKEWLGVLQQAKRALITCSRNPNHIYADHMSECHWCNPTATPIQQQALPPAQVYPIPIRPVTPAMPVSSGQKTSSTVKPTASALSGLMLQSMKWLMVGGSIMLALGLVVVTVVEGSALFSVLTLPMATSVPPTNTPQPAIPANMVYVPAGEFTMGSENGDSDEKPVHTVYVDEFYIDQYEVTNEQYRACVEAGDCEAPHNTDAYNDGGKGDHPVVYVNWQMSRDYCEWAGKRLPTEAEWEKAARGTDGREYPWGNEEPSCDRANYRGCVGDTTAVGSYEAGKSPYGAYDMAGNVWEWTMSAEEGYPYNKDDGRNDLDKNVSRVLRGGSWYLNTNLVRTAFRRWDFPTNSGDGFGFRCLRSP